MGHWEPEKVIGSLALLGVIELIISFQSIKSAENTIFWVSRIINSLSVLILFYFVHDANNNRYQDGAGPLLLVLPCSRIVFIICGLINLIGLFSQNWDFINILDLIFLILYFIFFKKINYF